MAVGIGAEFTSNFADSCPTWIVRKPRGNRTWECEVISDDWTGNKKVFGTEEIELALQMDRMYKRSVSEHEDWWNNQPVDSIVHYHNGFGNYVRGVIVNDNGVHKMKSTALVGAWRPYDLPSRDSDGTIQYGHHACGIVTGDLFQPNYTNMFEYRKTSQSPFPQDPTTWEAIDLSVPEATPEEKEKYRLEQIRQNIIKAAQDGDIVEAFKQVAFWLKQV